MNKRVQIVAIEGNTGCGKTKLLRWLSSFPNVRTYEEPIETWRNFSGHNLLALRYANPKQWSFAFQSLVQLTRLNMYANIDDENEKVRFIERSLHSNRYCFLESSKEMNYLNPVEFALLTEWFSYLEREGRIELDLIIYLKTSPGVALKRIQERSRSEETDITLDQLENIHQKYETWISAGASGFKVATVDADRGDVAVQQSVVQILQLHHIL